MWTSFHKADIGPFSINQHKIKCHFMLKLHCICFSLSDLFVIPVNAEFITEKIRYIVCLSVFVVYVDVVLFCFIVILFCYLVFVFCLFFFYMQLMMFINIIFNKDLLKHRRRKLKTNILYIIRALSRFCDIKNTWKTLLLCGIFDLYILYTAV